MPLVHTAACAAVGTFPVIRDVPSPTELDRPGWGGTPIARRACIRLLSGDGGSRIDVALTPEVGIEAVWLALQEAGVVETT